MSKEVSDIPEGESSSNQIDPQAQSEVQVLEQKLKSSRVFRKLKPHEKEELLTIAELTIIQQHKLHIGPIPDPESLKQYNEVIPNGADRIMKMAESQSEHRKSLESAVVKGGVRKAYIGQACALIIALAFGYGAYNLAMADHETVAGIMVSGTLISIVSVFVIGRKSKK